MKMNPKETIIANAYPNLFIIGENLLLNPTDWKDEPNPCHKWKNNSKKDRQYKPVRIGSANLWTNSGKYLVSSIGFTAIYL